MNLPLFLARGVARGGRQSISRTIIVIATVAVAISMATMILSSALVEGFKNEISKKAFGFWGHVHITDSAASFGILDTYNYPISNRQDFYPHLDTTGRVEYREFESALGLNESEPQLTRGGVDHNQQFIVLPGIVSFYRPGERLPEQEALILKGVGADFSWDRFGRYLIAGAALDVTPDSTSRGIVISSITATRLQAGVGDRLDFGFPDRNGRIRTRALRIGGIYKTGLEQFDREFAIVDLKQLRRLLNWEEDEVGGFEIFLDDIEDMEAFASYIHYDVLSQDLYAESIRRKFSSLFNWLDIQDYNNAIILALMIIVAIINMMTALLILILERTRMIGVLKALGQGNWSIRAVFLYWAGVIICFGLLFGNVLGLGICWLQKTFGFLRLDEENYYLDVAPIDVDLPTLLLLNAGTLAITLLFLVVPSYLVTRIDPVKAIRFK